MIDFEFGEGNRHHGPSGEWCAKVDGHVVARGFASGVLRDELAKWMKGRPEA